MATMSSNWKLMHEWYNSLPLRLCYKKALMLAKYIFIQPIYIILTLYGAVHVLRHAVLWNFRPSPLSSSRKKDQIWPKFVRTVTYCCTPPPPLLVVWRNIWTAPIQVDGNCYIAHTHTNTHFSADFNVKNIITTG